MNVEEIWKDVPQYEGIYQVSNKGRVKSLDRLNSSDRKCKGSILKLQKTGNGYLKIELYKNNSYKRFSVHRLVMSCFKGDSELVVDHINGVKDDNRLENLRYLTNRDNVSRGMLNKTSKYTGVSWDNSKQKWRAYLRIDTIGYSLGVFDSELEAMETYNKSLYEYLKDGTLPIKIKRTKYVLNQQNGVFSESLKEASETYGLCNKYLSLMLNNKRRNITNLVYV